MVSSPLSLYFHIPFCNKKCPYCHFYVIPNKEMHKQLLLEALILEWKALLPKIQGHRIVSIYFGGGTPTLFGEKAISLLLNELYKNAFLDPSCEITLEANPEEVTVTLMQGFKQAGINRISIGVQSLEKTSLTTLERGHSSEQAIKAIQDTAKSGFSNISIDLMYDLPGQTLESFERTLADLPLLPIQHLSLYNLTLEPHTAFYKRQKSLIPLLPTEEESLAMLQTAILKIEQAGLKRYEISAFAKEGFESVHNSGYWTARPFFGLGPSAFSYYEGRRFQNVASINQYAKRIKNGLSAVEFEEMLPYPQNVCELLAVQLRLVRGVEKKNLEKLPQETKETLEELKKKQYLEEEGFSLKLTEKGRLFYDTIAAELI